MLDGAGLVESPTALGSSPRDQHTPERRSGRSGEIEKEIARKVTLCARRRKRDDRLADHIGPSGNGKCCGHICSGRNTAGYALTPCQGAGSLERGPFETVMTSSMN